MLFILASKQHCQRLYARHSSIGGVGLGDLVVCVGIVHKTLLAVVIDVLDKLGHLDRCERASSIHIDYGKIGESYEHEYNQNVLITQY